jgi:hypothetical protein
MLKFLFILFVAVATVASLLAIVIIPLNLVGYLLFLGITCLSFYLLFVRQPKRKVKPEYMDYLDPEHEA